MAVEETTQTPCEICLSEVRMGKADQPVQAEFRGRTVEGLDGVAMCSRHRREYGVGKMERL